MSYQFLILGQRYNEIGHLFWFSLLPPVVLTSVSILYHEFGPYTFPSVLNNFVLPEATLTGIWPLVFPCNLEAILSTPSSYLISCLSLSVQGDKERRQSFLNALWLSWVLRNSATRQPLLLCCLVTLTLIPNWGVDINCSMAKDTFWIFCQSLIHLPLTLVSYSGKLQNTSSFQCRTNLGLFLAYSFQMPDHGGCHPPSAGGAAINQNPEGFALTGCRPRDPIFLHLFA